ncbi:MAG: serine/threonine protein kinase [Deltaproteobacteria bacterium]|nr:serine/threonine protein kinase [Deltaproteobacteria bacterium]
MVVETPIRHRPGQIIAGKYELIEVAGRGGMATVWKATLHGVGRFRRTVAVKQMHEHLAGKRLYVDMFCEEARVGAFLQDPNIAQVYDFLSENGQYYLIMEWVPGIDLGNFISYFRDRGRHTHWEMVAAAGIGILRGLAAAHERENETGTVTPIVHRDVSPHNILLSSDGLVKLIDFGLSLAGDRTEELTEPGIVKGKMSYLSPEIVKGGRPEPLSDVFAVGSVLWEALTGRRLFEGENDLEVYGKLRNCQVQPLRPIRRDVPKELIHLVHRALSEEPRERFDSAREMANHLGQILKTSRVARDLRRHMGRTVIDARRHTTETTGTVIHQSSSATPIAELEERTAVAEAPQGKKGLLHRLPWFGRKRG